MEGLINPIFDQILERLKTAESSYSTYLERFNAGRYQLTSELDKPWHFVINEKYLAELPMHLTNLIKLLGKVPLAEQMDQIIHQPTGTVIEILSVKNGITFFLENSEELKELIQTKRILDEFPNKHLNVVSTAGEINRAFLNISVIK